ncbi:AMP-binding protein [Pseudonocardia kujensis]|uniref:class I adenylate-forming enzyme family protein n=1 Tax=Pseudonocardia kujensis TaxID=1128675 RepID=UPI001E3F5D20|nr:AMP-binding protein [Pseudonocardia kujensis]MCE0764098.1 AMP-binding protein [Pseudonocardia kujensis]
MSTTDTPTSLGGLLRASARRFPAAEIVFPDERCTYVELDALADEFAAVFAATGVAPGDKVGLWVPPSIDMIAAIVGCMRAGGVAVPISDRFRAEELRYVAGHADLVTLLTRPATAHSDRPAEIREALPSLEVAPSGELSCAEAPLLRRLLVLGDEAPAGFRSTRELGLRRPPATGRNPVRPSQDQADEDEVAYLMYTSGTSAAPKACMITHHGVLVQAESLAHHRYMLDPDCAFWCPLPLFHNAGLATLTACITAGAKFVHAGAFEPGQALQMLEEERVTHGIPAFETIWLRVLDHPDFSGTDLSRLRVVMNAGSEDLLRKLQARLPHVSQVANYGMTEATGHLSMTAIDDPLEIRVTTGGLPLPHMEVRIVDPDSGRVLGADEPGEIQFRGPSRFLGYYKDPEATAAAIDAEGWFRSGDRGTLDAAGRLTFRGRLKDMLKVGGENVSSLEVESYLLRHSAVNVVAVVGAPDEYYGEVPVAYVELAPGAEATEQELIDFCVDRIATFKVPRYVRFVDSWPMSGTKIRKVELRERIRAELAAARIREAPRVRSTRARAAAHI